MQNNCFARSHKNGIYFYSQVLPGIVLNAYLDEEDNFQKEIIIRDIDKNYEKEQNPKRLKNRKICNFLKILLASIIALAVVILVGYLIYSYIGTNSAMVLAAIMYSMTVILKTITFATSSYDTKKVHSDGRSTAKFHSAEHMVYTAYHRLNRVPMFNELKETTKFSKNCGSLAVIRRWVYEILFYVMYLLIVLYCVCGLNLLVLAVYTLMVIPLVIIERKFNFFMFLEVFFLSKPTDKELRLALKGLKETLKMDNQLKQFLETGDEIFLIDIAKHSA